jgi:hypothetical protein
MAQLPEGVVGLGRGAGWVGMEPGVGVRTGVAFLSGVAVGPVTVIV